MAPFEISTSGAEITHQLRSHSNAPEFVCANVVNFNKDFVVELRVLEFKMDW